MTTAREARMRGKRGKVDAMSADAGFPRLPRYRAGDRPRFPRLARNRAHVHNRAPDPRRPDAGRLHLPQVAQPARLGDAWTRLPGVGCHFPLPAAMGRRLPMAAVAAGHRDLSPLTWPPDTLTP